MVVYSAYNYNVYTKSCGAVSEQVSESGFQVDATIQQWDKLQVFTMQQAFTDKSKTFCR